MQQFLVLFFFFLSFFAPVFSCCRGSIKIKKSLPSVIAREEELPPIIFLADEEVTFDGTAPLTTLAGEVQEINFIRSDIRKHHLIAAPKKFTLDVLQDITIKNGKTCTILGHITSALCSIQAKSLRGSGKITARGDICIRVNQLNFKGSITCGGTCSIIVEEPVKKEVLDNLVISGNNLKIYMQEQKDEEFNSVLKDQCDAVLSPGLTSAADPSTGVSPFGPFDSVFSSE